jgi:hypothetical protein
LFAAALTACGTDGGFDVHGVKPILLPAMPQTVNTPVLVKIPIGMTEPCPVPPRRSVTTDVELLETADAFKVAMRCNAANLKAIEAAQAQGGGESVQTIILRLQRAGVRDVPPPRTARVASRVRQSAAWRARPVPGLDGVVASMPVQSAPWLQL